jgi:hypothetical protein
MGLADKQQVDLLIQIVDLLKRIERNLRPVRPLAVAIKLATFKINQNGRVRTEDMNLLLSENAEIDILGIEDAAGNPAVIDGDAKWSVSGDLGLGELQVAADNKSALFVRNGKVGTCAVEVRGDADLGPDVSEIVASVELVCLGGQAVKINLDAKAVPAVTPAP